MKIQIAFMMIFAVWMSTPAIATEHAHNETKAAHQENDAHADHGDHEEGGVIKLSPAQIKQAGIQTQIISLQPSIQTVNAPGNVYFNAYKLADVTTLVDGVIHMRHVYLGDKVAKGQKLVTLTSSALANSEADYLRAEAEHRKSKLDLNRLKGLAAEKIISASRLLQARSIHQSAHANLAAARATLASYGLSSGKIDTLIDAKRFGRLTLHAPSAGTVITDDFRIGQHIAAGTLLVKIADETTVWVEAKVPEAQLSHIHPGQKALIYSKSRAKAFVGHVTSLHHRLDPTTRTGGVRLEVENPDDALQPGMFVDTSIAAGKGQLALLLAEQAVQRQGSELIVFVEDEAGHFERREIRIGKASMGFVPVLEGVKEGESVVVSGAFVLASELAKAGFEVHNH
ncbi:MAG: efflux RND transporter periplasmic adaptor subunit [Mariprofundaceae bacterium]|nr:efflux RND transporter periplasmic adaptor subunit [Mariprofundaceae bacterium]